MNRKGHNWAMSEVFNSPLTPAYPAHSRPFDETFTCGPASVKLRQCLYEGELWFLTGWMEARDVTGRWYTSMRLETGGKVIYLQEDPLWFQQTFLPSLPWVELVPAPPSPLAVSLAAQLRRAAR